MTDRSPPLLPLVLDHVPPGLVRALAQQGVPYSRRGNTAAEGRFVLFDSRNGSPRPLQPGQTAIDIDRLRHGRREDPFESLLDERSTRRQWRIEGLTLGEEIARVDHRAVRQELLEGLRNEIEQAGGIWLAVAAFPFPYRSALNFRIDYDRYDPRDFDTTLRALTGNENASSHFVNGSAYLPHPHALARLCGLDVGSHGYRHHTYLTEEENLANVGRGIEVLRAAGIEPSGYVSPLGRFHHTLLTALEKHGVGHSSEFGLACDELPFYPRESSVLQIPIHPVCLGLFLDSVRGEGDRYTEAQRGAARVAIDYLRKTAWAKYRSGEPVFFYGHPTDRLGAFPEVLRAVFDTADTFAAIWKTTLTQFAAWWRERAAIRLRVDRLADGFVVATDSLPAGYRVGIEYYRGRHVARLPLQGPMLQFSPAALAYENRTVRPEVRPVRVDRPEGLRGRFRRWIDFERETPIEEIRTTNLRNWAKRTFRRLHP